MWLFYCFNFERIYDDLKSKSSCFLWKNINFNKNETESKMENPHILFREMNLVLKKDFIKTTDPPTTDLPTHRPLLTTYPPAHRPLTHQFMLKQKTSLKHVLHSVILENFKNLSFSFS